MYIRLLQSLVLLALLNACGPPVASPDRAGYEADILAWRADRLARLKGPDGYLNLAGLYWLSPGVVTIGSADDNDLVFPAAAAAHIGQLDVSPAGVRLAVNDNATVVHGDQAVTSLLLADDTTDAPVTVQHGSLVWNIIRRDDRFALRLRDLANPAIEAFPPLEYFPIDPAYRVAAKLELFDAPKILNVDTVIEGIGWKPESPGKVVFSLDGERHELEAYASGEQLFFVFGDRTSGRETYPAGRFLYADWPEPGAVTLLDFNRAYNPPCAFNDFATCPVASPQNRLPVRIEAGEKFAPALHWSPDASR